MWTSIKTRSFIILLISTVMFAWADSSTLLPVKKRKGAVADSVATKDSLKAGNFKADEAGVDTLSMDSLQLAIYHHNKAVDDSIHADSLNRAKKNGIDAPVNYTADDSLVYDAQTKDAKLFGNAEVKYENMDLTSAKIRMNLDSSLVHATGSPDSTQKNGIKGRPVFAMGSDTYDTDTIAFNFKTKKGYVQNAYTEQQDGFLTSKISKRMDTRDVYLAHGRYTTCDKEHPDFYISLSRAKVRPGKDVVFGPAYLVVADVPLPFAIPYGFFPFTKSYSSGFIMPSYGDENSRGFYLRDGGYYFALSDKMDLKLIGEIYTKGSWGLTLTSNYNKRYKYSGTFLASYQDTRTGDKGMPEFQDSVESPSGLESQSFQFSLCQCQLCYIEL